MSRILVNYGQPQKYLEFLITVQGDELELFSLSQATWQRSKATCYIGALNCCLLQLE